MSSNKNSINYKVYKHTNLHNGKVYIGITSTSVEKRSGSHGEGYKKNAPFYRAICKYGWDSFSHEVLLSGVGITQETTDITGKQGRLLNTLKRNKAVTVSGNNGLLSGGMLETQVGNRFQNKKTSIMYPDYLTVTGNQAVTTYKAVGTAGNEIESVYLRNEDGTLGEVLTQGDAVATGVFTYDPATKTIAFNADEIKDGTEIAVYYFRQIQANVLENLSDQYSDKVALYIDAFAEDKCANVYRVQFFIPKADFNGNFDIQMGDSQSVHAFEARSLAGACGTSGALWTYTIFGEDTPDAE